MTASYAHVCKTVQVLKDTHAAAIQCRDMNILCRSLGILLNPQPMGPDGNSIKGFFLISKRMPVITYNCDLPKVVQSFIIAHEIGHAILHRHLKIKCFRDVNAFDESDPCEKEANLFAAELLMEDADVLEKMNEDSTFFGAAAGMNVPAELLDFKFRLMKWKGYKMVEPPICAANSFLKHLDIPENCKDGCP